MQASNLDWAAVLNDFQVAYGEGTVPHTLRPESEGLSPEDGSGVGFVSAITAPIDSEFLEYQATSQSGGEIITDQLSLELADRISCWLEGGDTGDCDLSAPSLEPQELQSSMSSSAPRERELATAATRWSPSPKWPRGSCGHRTRASPT